MSTNPPTLTREQWRTVLDDTDLPTFGELVSTIEAATMIDAEGPAAEQLVDGAVGDLLEADPEASGMFDVDDYPSVITVGYETYLCRTPNPPTPIGGMGNHLPPSRGGCVGVIEKEEDRGWSE
jgi:hypothetical protein